MSITASPPTEGGAAETGRTVKPSILPAAIFIVVETFLVADTISVILFDQIYPRNTGGGPIAILLSVALLANLGLVCGLAAAHAADTMRRSKRARARAVIRSFPEVRVPAGEHAR